MPLSPGINRFRLLAGLGGNSLGATAAPPVIPSYDADAQRLFDKMLTDPGADRRTLVDGRFRAGKQKSFWAKFDCAWVHAAHGAETGRLDWLDRFGDRRYDCLPVNSPVFTVDRGYMGDGIASYLDTQFNPARATSPRYSQNSGSLGIRSNTDNTGNGSLAGYYDPATTKGTTINPRTPSQRMTGRVNSNAPAESGDGSVASAAAMFHTNRIGAGTDAASAQIYRNGVLLSTVFPASASLAVADGNFRLGSISNTSFRACQFSMGWIGAGLTTQEAQDVFDWFEVYRQAVGVV